MPKQYWNKIQTYFFFRFLGSFKKTRETILLDILIFDELSQLTWAHLQLLPRIFHCICMLMYSFNLHLVSAEYISTQLLWNRNTLSIFLIEYSSRTIWCSLFFGSIAFLQKNQETLYWGTKMDAWKDSCSIVLNKEKFETALNKWYKLVVWDKKGA